MEAAISEDSKSGIVMEKRNVATARRAVEDDDDELRREASLFGPPEKRASVSRLASATDEAYDEDTGTGDRRGFAG